MTQRTPGSDAARTLTVTWDDPVASAEAGRALSGLEYMRAIAEGRAAPAPIARLMSFEPVAGAIHEGDVTFRCVPGEQHFNPIGIVHGGLVSTLLDSVMGCAVHTTLPVGVGYATLELKVNMVRAITLDTGPISAHGTVIHGGGRIATAEGRVVAEETGKLLAHATTTCMILRPGSD
jgi:uncharacterized protein (TIGR00369 family)